MTKLNITDTVLDKLGFSPYWDEHGTWGGRTLTFKNGTKFRIIEQEEMDGDFDQAYVANHFYFAGWFAIPKTSAGHYDLFFLHQMFECIKKEYPDCVDEFTSKCESLNMGSYIYDQSQNIIDIVQSRIDSLKNEMEYTKRGMNFYDKTQDKIYELQDLLSEMKHML